MLSRMFSSIGAKLGFGFGLAILITAATALIGIAALRQNLASFSQFEAGVTKELGGQRAMAKVHELRREALAFATGDAEAHARAVSVARQALAALEAKAANEASGPHAARVAGAVRDLRAYAAHVDRLPALAPGERLPLINGDMRAQALGVLKVLGELDAEEARVRQALQASAQAASLASKQMLYTAMGVALLAMIGIGFLLCRSIAAPLRRVTRDLARLSDGDTHSNPRRARAGTRSGSSSGRAWRSRRACQNPSGSSRWWTTCRSR